MTDKRRALLSVSDKSGLVDFGRALAALGFELVSTGGTARALQEAGVAVTGVAAVTGFPEILSGRVKTLHPLIHGAILADLDREEQRRELNEHGIIPCDLVVVNLYPFAETVARPGCSLAEAVENIDIGGPTMIRAAAKNHAHVAVVVSPARYGAVLEELETGGAVSPETRLRLAAEAFAHTAAYEAAIDAYFRDLAGEAKAFLPPELDLHFRKVQDLRYGENPQQAAAFYAAAGVPAGLAAARQLQGKELSFNNLNDLHAACEVVREFRDTAVAAVKHANPCGVGTGADVLEAYRRAYDADPVSIFGGVVAVNRPLEGAAAEQMSKIFLEVIAAPAFSEEALAILGRKEDIRLLELKVEDEGAADFDLKKVTGGLLVQGLDREPVAVEGGTVVTARRPEPAEWQALAFAQKVVKHVRSNAIVVAGADQTYGIGAGQMNRVGAARLALEQAGERARGAALGSDAFFPFPDTVELAVRAGITAIVQPGGSLKDAESIALCDRYGLTMVCTGRRYFKH